MQIGSKYVDRFYLKRLYYKFVYPILHPAYKPKDIRRTRFIVNLCNACNLNCFSCSNLMDRPMGSNVYRNHYRETTPEQLDLFLERVKDWKKEAWVRLTGGEPTLIGPSKLQQMVEVCKKHNRRVDMVTNGHRLMELDTPHIFDYLILDDHGINRDKIEEVISWLNTWSYDKFKVITFTAHRDLELQRKDNVSFGPKCVNWLYTTTLWQDLVYPCCVMHSIEGFEDNQEIGESLRRNGYTIDNPHLAETLENWKTTIPNEALRACLFGCWHGGNNIVWKNIEKPQTTA